MCSHANSSFSETVFIVYLLSSAPIRCIPAHGRSPKSHQLTNTMKDFSHYRLTCLRNSFWENKPSTAISRNRGSSAICYAVAVFCMRITWPRPMEWTAFSTCKHRSLCPAEIHCFRRHQACYKSLSFFPFVFISVVVRKKSVKSVKSANRARLHESAEWIIASLTGLYDYRPVNTYCDRVLILAACPLESNERRGRAKQRCRLVHIRVYTRKETMI